MVHPRFVSGTAGSGATSVFLDWNFANDDLAYQAEFPLSTGAYHALHGFYLQPEDGPRPAEPPGRYRAQARAAELSGPGTINMGEEEIPLTTVLAAARRRLLASERGQAARRASKMDTLSHAKGVANDAALVRELEVATGLPAAPDGPHWVVRLADWESFGRPTLCTVMAFATRREATAEARNTAKRESLGEGLVLDHAPSSEELAQMRLVLWTPPV